MVLCPQLVDKIRGESVIAERILELSFRQRGAVHAGVGEIGGVGTADCAGDRPGVGIESRRTTSRIDMKQRSPERHGKRSAVKRVGIVVGVLRPGNAPDYTREVIVARGIDRAGLRRIVLRATTSE